MHRFLSLLLIASAPVLAQDYKIAIVGLVHGHAWGYLQSIAEGKAAPNAKVQLVGVAEPNQDLLAEARRAGVVDNLLFTDYRKMIEDKKPDIVWAFVENNRHLEIVEFCAPRKINVIFEKPLASAYRDAVAIRELAHKYGIQVMTNYQMAWWPANYTAKAEADSGALGTVYRLRGVVGHGGPGSEGVRDAAFFSWLTDPVKNGAGALMDFGCYNALWSLWYLGRPQTVYAEVLHLQPQRFPKVEDNATIVLHYNNAEGIFEASWDLPRSFQDLEVFGRKASEYMSRPSVEERQGGESKTLTLAPLAAEKSKPVAYMVEAIRSGKPLEGLVALDINVDVIEIIDAAKESVSAGRPIQLPARR